MSKLKSKTFDMNTNKAYLTIPNKHSLDLTQVKHNIHALHLPDVQYVASLETGETGYQHIHVVILLPYNHRFTMRELDSIGQTHGHYKKISNTPGKVIAYVCKDGLIVYHPPQFGKFISDAIFQYGYPGVQEKIAVLLTHEDGDVPPVNRQHPGRSINNIRDLEDGYDSD